MYVWGEMKGILQVWVRKSFVLKKVKKGIKTKNLAKFGQINVSKGGSLKNCFLELDFYRKNQRRIF